MRVLLLRRSRLWWLVLLPALLLLRSGHGRGAPEVYYRGDERKPVVALAVNVVWGTPEVPRMLAVLRREGARATFFLGGRWVMSNPSLARQLAREGMELGNHGWGHRHLLRLGLGANREEINRAREEIRKATGVDTRLYAPAYGELGRVVEEAAGLEGQKIIMWSVDTIDWRPWHTPAIIEERVLSRAKAGSIVLMHPTDRTVAALPRIIRGLRERGLRVGTVGQVLP